jgi:hypothetical protein
MGSGESKGDKVECRERACFQVNVLPMTKEV